MGFHLFSHKWEYVVKQRPVGDTKGDVRKCKTCNRYQKYDGKNWAWM